MIQCLFGILTQFAGEAQRAPRIVAVFLLGVGVASAQVGQTVEKANPDAAYEHACTLTQFSVDGKTTRVRAQSELSEHYDSLLSKHATTFDDSTIWATTFYDVSINRTLKCSKLRKFTVYVDRTGRFLSAASRPDDSLFADLPWKVVPDVLQRTNIQIIGLPTDLPSISLQEALELASFSMPDAAESCYAFLYDVHDRRYDTVLTLWLIVGIGRPRFGSDFEADCTSKEVENAITALDAQSGRYYFATFNKQYRDE